MVGAKSNRNGVEMSSKVLTLAISGSVLLLLLPLLLFTRYRTDQVVTRLAKDQVNERLRGDLFRAVLAGDGTGVYTSLAQGADPNSLDDQGRPALVVAVEEDSVTIASRLLKSGAKVNGSDSRGATPLHYALRRTSPEKANLQMVRLLLSRGASATVRSQDSMTPLDELKDAHPANFDEALRMLRRWGH